jgi:membrane protein
VEDRLPRSVLGLVDGVRSSDVLLHSGGLAFYALISVAPFVVISFWAASALVGSERLEDLGTTVDALAPTGVRVTPLVTTLADVGTGLGLGALASALWPATAYGSGLVQALDRISHRPDRSLQGARGRLKALLFVVLLPAFVLSALGSTYLVTGLLGGGTALRIASWVLAAAGGFAAGTVTLVLIYRIFGPDPLPWRPLLQGAGAAALAIAAMSVGYAVYLGQGADFEERVAGSGLASVVLLALWLYLANVILLTGFCWARACAGPVPREPASGTDAATDGDDHPGG